MVGVRHDQITAGHERRSQPRHDPGGAIAVRHGARHYRRVTLSDLQRHRRRPRRHVLSTGGDRHNRRVRQHPTETVAVPSRVACRRLRQYHLHAVAGLLPRRREPTRRQCDTDHRAARTRQPSGSTWWLNFDQRRANTSPTRFLRGGLEWPV